MSIFYPAVRRLDEAGPNKMRRRIQNGIAAAVVVGSLSLPGVRCSAQRCWNDVRFVYQATLALQQLQSQASAGRQNAAELDTHFACNEDQLLPTRLSTPIRLKNFQLAVDSRLLNSTRQ